VNGCCLRDFASGLAQPLLLACIILGALKSQAAVNNAEWVMRQPPQAFTIQLIAVSSQEQAELFVESETVLNEYPLAIYRYQKQGKLLYAVSLGSFIDLQTTEQTREELPVRLAAVSKTWLRRMDEVQAQIRTTLQR